mmetsp:Transcript_83032/g.240230  ORF Transcript_83032/g.240230 Transcript_83032/m.240230 type:complete len:203 (-) Transcript_83032:577-1185(-)
MDQKVRDRGEVRLQAVELEQRFPRSFADHRIHDAHRVTHALHPHDIPEDHGGVVRGALEDDSRAVDQCDLRVKLHLLENLGHTGAAPRLHGAMPLHGIDDGALSRVRVPDNPYSQLPLCLSTISHSRVVLQELHELVGADDSMRALQQTLRGIRQTCHRVRWPLCSSMSRFECKHWEGALEMLHPSLCGVLGHKVHLVQQDD